MARSLALRGKCEVEVWPSYAVQYSAFGDPIVKCAGILGTRVETWRVNDHKFFAISSPRTPFPIHQMLCQSDGLRRVFISGLSRQVSELVSGSRSPQPTGHVWSSSTTYFTPSCSSHIFACTFNDTVLFSNALVASSSSRHSDQMPLRP